LPLFPREATLLSVAHDASADRNGRKNLWLIRGSGSVQNADEFKIGFLKFDAYYAPQQQKHGASLP
jgi:hypothetical protein